MKILLIDDENLYSHNLCEALSKSHEEINVLLYGPLSSKSRLSYRIANSKKVWTTKLYPFQIFKQTLIDKPEIVHIQYEINTFGPLYANFLFPLLLLLLKITRAKIVITIHSVLDSIQKDTLPHPFKTLAPTLLKFPLNLFYKLTEKFSDEIIVHSSVFRASLIQTFNLNGEKIAVIPHGVNATQSIIKQDKLAYWQSFLGQRKMILFFGVLSPRKGLEYLIKSFDKISYQHSEYLLIIAGFEPDYYKSYQKTLQNLTDSMGLNDKVYFTGFIEDEDAHCLFSLAEIVVLPYAYSLSASGPLSIAIQHRKPIVATKTGFFNETLKDGYDALLVPPMDYERLAQAIENLLTDTSLKERLSNNINFEALKCSWDRVAETTLKTYLNAK